MSKRLKFKVGDVLRWTDKGRGMFSAKFRKKMVSPLVVVSLPKEYVGKGGDCDDGHSAHYHWKMKSQTTGKSDVLHDAWVYEGDLLELDKFLTEMNRKKP